MGSTGFKDRCRDIRLNKADVVNVEDRIAKVGAVVLHLTNGWVIVCIIDDLRLRP